MEPFLQYLKRKKVVVGDGAIGTMLIEHGLKPGQCPESMTLEKPGLLETIARQYLDSGAEMIQTNTFGASPLRLQMHRLEEETEQLNHRAVEIAKRASGNNVYVAASIGPSGRLLKPYGDVEPTILFESYRRQIKALVAAGADLLCIETMSDLKEAVIALKAARDISLQIPVTTSLTFDRTPRGFFTIMGDSILQAAQELQKAGATIIGSNCGNGSDTMMAIAREFKKHSSLPLLIRPNAGIPEIRAVIPFYPETPERMAENIGEIIRQGVALIGGCCGTTPTHIAAFRQVADSLRG